MAAKLTGAGGGGCAYALVTNGKLFDIPYY